MDGNNFVSTLPVLSATGNYVLSVKDAHGCSYSISYGNTATSTCDWSNLDLTVETHNGTLTLEATGGTAPYQYSLEGIAYSSNNVFTSLPANHTTRRPGEHCSMYLVEKGATRLVYATDTGGIMGEAATIAGIDAHYQPAKPITALVMEATMGIGHDIDFRIYAHSSVETVDRVVKVLQMTKRYTPAPGQKVYLTHMARTLHGTHAEIAASAPAPIAPAYDGLEIML